MKCNLLENHYDHENVNRQELNVLGVRNFLFLKENKSSEKNTRGKSLRLEKQT